MLEYGTKNKDLPQSPLAPLPPPHSPQYPLVSQAMATDDTSLVKSPVPSSQSGTLSPSNSSQTHHGFDFGSSVSGAAMPTPDTENVSAASPRGPLSKTQEQLRHSRESGSTSSTQNKASTESSVATSASSVSGINESSQFREKEEDCSPESSMAEGNESVQVVQPFQYHHMPLPPRVSSAVDPRAASQPNLLDSIGGRGRQTPNQFLRRSSLPRPNSSYSVYSDFGPRGRSPGLLPGGSHARTPSMSSRRSPDIRPSSYAELLNIPYPQPAPAPMALDNSFLRTNVGSNASLLSTQKTLEMYRQNVKKTNDFEIQYSFAQFLVGTAKEQGIDFEDKSRKKGSQPSTPVNSASSSSYELIREARQLLQNLAKSGYPFAQYYLADGYASGIFSKGKEDWSSAFPLFVLAAKHGHAESAYRTALCYEFGAGCRKDPARAVQFLRSAASKRHPGAMTRLGQACLSGDLGEKRYREGIKWMKLATEAADEVYNNAPYLLGCLYETGYGDDVFQDESYAADLFTRAADLGHAEASFRMGDAYEHGKLTCPRDPALSVHFYTSAAERGHAAGMMGLCAWYMVGAHPFLEQDEAEAYEWARRSAELGMSTCTWPSFPLLTLHRVRQGTICRRVLHRDRARLPQRHTRGEPLVRQGSRRRRRARQAAPHRNKRRRERRRRRNRRQADGRCSASW